MDPLAALRAGAEEMGEEAAAGAVEDAVDEIKDRVGLGFRSDLAAAILGNLDAIDVVEVIAEDYLFAPTKKIRALNTLASQVPVMLHGVSLGMASTVSVERKRLERTARLLDRVKNFLWSEHLAFVRGGGTEIGHLAFPPRCEATIEGTLRNLARARQIVGTNPHVENIATLIEPPGSTLSESEFLGTIIRNSDSPLLLDLHNVYTNSINLGYDPYQMLESLPESRISVIHISGGRMIDSPGSEGERQQRMLDDHLHDVCDEVYDFLEFVASRSPGPLTVILERDGNFPEMSSLLVQLEKAREALRRGRTLRKAA